MGRINDYELDNVLSDDDKIIITDADDNNKTKNVTLLELYNYIVSKL